MAASSIKGGQVCWGLFSFSLYHCLYLCVWGVQSGMYKLVSVHLVVVSPLCVSFKS